MWVPFGATEPGSQTTELVTYSRNGFGTLLGVCSAINVVAAILLSRLLTGFHGRVYGDYRRTIETLCISSLVPLGWQGI
jgi:hypothetical protein